MIAKVNIKYVRMSARKARLVVDLIDGKTVEEANFILDNVNKKAAVSLKKALNSAFANANQNKQDKLLAKDMSISGIRVDDGPMLKRYRAATMGRATPIRHRTSHIYLELDKIAAKTGAKKKVPKGVKK